MCVINVNYVESDLFVWPTMIQMTSKKPSNNSWSLKTKENKGSLSRISKKMKKKNEETHKILHKQQRIYHCV